MAHKHSSGSRGHNRRWSNSTSASPVRAGVQPALRLTSCKTACACDADTEEVYDLEGVNVDSVKIKDSGRIDRQKDHGYCIGPAGDCGGIDFSVSCVDSRGKEFYEEQQRRNAEWMQNTAKGPNWVPRWSMRDKVGLGGKMLPPEVNVAETAAEQNPSEFVVSIDNSTGEEVLGLRFIASGNTLQICDIHEWGLAHLWNTCIAKEHYIEKGDIILEVNGIRDDSSSMMKEFRKKHNAIWVFRVQKLLKDDPFVEM
eukprot:gnl/MRDRNA2_/MRDRNA2_150913_c0_seq1.p1 gnl/MRDRNA2_/MRDRNA2_150913_c0~~gnl/MRDRNA2_/MRDRNA2_150913_c0_seq1.p1  ORF type:complete len:255 (+),score=48.03 gnl/MRDRNA2_/MRDRNA2_150913_c0_seq1:133-897(+)